MVISSNIYIYIYIYIYITLFSSSNCCRLQVAQNVLSFSCHSILGLTIGGTWGLYEGLRNPDGKTMKLRLNSVLNGMTRRGPFLANSLGVVGKVQCL